MRLQRWFHSMRQARGARAFFGVVLILGGVLAAPLCPCHCEDLAVAAPHDPEGTATQFAGHDDSRSPDADRDCPCGDDDCPDLTATVPSPPADATLGATPGFAATLVASAFPVPAQPAAQAPGHARDTGPPIPGSRFEILRI